MLAQNQNNPSQASRPQAQSGGWWRVAIIGRNPKVTVTRALILAVTCFVVFKFMLLPVKVRGISMYPTYKDNSFNLINRLAYLRHEPRRGDVVGIRLGPANAPYGAPSVMYMKRVVGLPGESVAFASGQLLINGAVIDEPYLKEHTDWTAAPVTNGPSQYYVVGDNRSMPQEDHEHGRAAREQIVGKVLF